MESEDYVNKRLWNTCLEMFPILKVVQRRDESVEIYTENVDNMLLEKGFIPLLYHMIFNIIRKNISVEAVFWDNISVEDEWKTLESLTSNIRNLNTRIMKIELILNKLEPLRELHMNANINTQHSDDDSLKTCMDFFNLIIRSKIMASLDKNYKQIFYNLYLASYKAFTSENNHPTEDDLETDSRLNHCTYCNNLLHKCKCKQYLEDANYVFRFLSSIEIVEFIVPIFKQMLGDQINRLVTKVCKGNYYSGTLDRVLKWFRNKWDTYVVFMTGHFGYDDIIHKTEMDNMLMECYSSVGISQIFDIIIEYPESSEAIDDLRRSLEITQYYDVLVNELGGVIEKKLLNIGASTPDILSAYILAYQTLQQIDPTNKIVQTITTPILLYLKTRSDAVYCVVNNIMLDDTNAEIIRESILNETVPEIRKEDVFIVIDDIAQDDEQPAQLNGGSSNDLRIETGQPINEERSAAAADEAVDSNAITHQKQIDNKRRSIFEISDDEKQPTNHRDTHRAFDIVSIFVDVLASKQVFIGEYQKLLADRLLTEISYDMCKEHRCLELFKIRFGDKNSVKLEAMLKDMTDSRRLCSYIETDDEFRFLKNDFMKNVCIMSTQVWPQFKDVSLRLPDELQKYFDNYRKGYEKYRANRTIIWKPHLGIVSLNVIMKNRKISVTVTPAHAVIIYHFQNQDTWSLSSLAEITDIKPVVVRKKISYWISQGIICEKLPDMFALTPEDGSSLTFYKPKLNLSVVYDEDGFEPAVVTSEEIKEEELQAFWSYISGMLNSLNSLTLDRIRQMYTMFSAANTGSKITTNQLKVFLDSKVRAGDLLVNDNCYSVPK